jgi:hypothetical protein
LSKEPELPAEIASRPNRLASACLCAAALVMACGTTNVSPGLNGAAVHSGGVAQASGALLSVGPGGRYPAPCDAFAAASDGDVIEIDGAGAYRGDTCGIHRDHLTIRGVNGRPKIDAGGMNAMGKGTWVVIGTGTVIENVEMFGARVAGRNGAAIRLDGKHLTLRDSYLHDNEMNILTNNDGVSNVVIENSVFRGLKAAYPHSLYHNIYIGHINSLVFRYNYAHDADVGHNLKSRAEVNTIAYNRFSSTEGSQPSYEIDLPNAGLAYVIGNVLQQPALNQNPGMLTFGVEGASNARQELHVVNNTFLNDDAFAGTFVVVGSGVTTPIHLQNNVFAGTGAVTNQPSAIEQTNYHAPAPAFMDRANFDLRPAPRSPMIDAGSPPDAALAPAAQYAHVARSRPRPLLGCIDIGAYETEAR